MTPPQNKTAPKKKTPLQKKEAEQNTKKVLSNSPNQQIHSQNHQTKFPAARDFPACRADCHEETSQSTGITVERLEADSTRFERNESVANGPPCGQLTLFFSRERPPNWDRCCFWVSLRNRPSLGGVSKKYFWGDASWGVKGKPQEPTATIWRQTI